MSISYPGAIDSFPVPSLPEDTSLSEAGTGTRNHTEHHADLGAAIVALQQNTALRSHDHSGGTGIGSSPKLIQANTHQNADTDAGLTSIHHTLGAGAFQAAPGNHIHGYNTLTDVPLKVCTSQSRPANPFVGMQIWETDTNRKRVWGGFAGNTTQPGLYGHDSFGRVSSVDLGPSLWSQTYNRGAGNGIMATPDGNSASWIDQGNQNTRCIARRINPLDRHTDTDDQIITFRTGAIVIEDHLIFTEISTNDIYFRMSDDGSQYFRCFLSEDNISFAYTLNGPDEEVSMGSITVGTQIANCEWMFTIVNRTITVYRNGELQGSIVESNQQSAKGPNNRGWGFGMSAGARGFGQTTPANITDIFIQDVAYYNSTNRWNLIPGGSTPVLRLLQGARQVISPNAGSIMEWRNETEDTFNFFDPNVSRTDITIKEPGEYWVNCNIAWDAGFLGDQAQLGIEINGLDTPYKAWEFVRGNGFIAGFPQTVNFSAPIRFGEGDVLRIRARHNWGFDIFTQTATSYPRIDSRLEVLYISP